MSGCESCAKCEEEPWLDLFECGCQSCTGRALALVSSPGEELEMPGGAYLEVLERLFPHDPIAGHRHVKRWRSRIAAFEARSQAAKASS